MSLPEGSGARSCPRGWWVVVITETQLLKSARRFLLPLAGAVFLLNVFACGGKAAETEAAGPNPGRAPLADKPLAAVQSHLLELAFDAASAIPVDPHIKDRCKAQEAVVDASLKLDQPRRALRYLENIPNWRRGVGYADLALYCIQHGASQEAKGYLPLADAVSEQAEDWRKDRIRARIVQVQALLGQAEKAAVYQAGVVPREMGKVAARKAGLGGEENFDEAMQSLDALLAAGDFDRMCTALDGCARLYNRFYNDATRRALVETRIGSSLEKMPPNLRIDELLAMAGSALKHADSATALRWVDEAQSLMDGARWSAEDRVPVAAHVIKARFLAGDKQKARKDADALRVLYAAHRRQIIDIFRARTLCPLAEAYQAMGASDTARQLYRQAVDEGAVNPNARPRAEALAATCCSMALSGVEPDAALEARLDEVRNGLREPW